MIDQINILDCVDIINNSVVSYEGMRGYLDTGGLKSNKIVEIMENAVNLEVPNKVDYESGPNWGQIK